MSKVLTLASATAGKFSQARRVSSPGRPSRWPRRIREAVMVASPMPSPTKSITLRATGRADPVLPSPDSLRRNAALASSYQKSRSVDLKRAEWFFCFNYNWTLEFSFQEMERKRLLLVADTATLPSETFSRENSKNIYVCALQSKRPIVYICEFLLLPELILLCLPSLVFCVGLIKHYNNRVSCMAGRTCEIFLWWPWLHQVLLLTNLNFNVFWAGVIVIPSKIHEKYKLSPFCFKVK